MAQSAGGFTVKPRRRETILWVEGLGFGLFIVLAWLTEIMRLPHLIFAESGTVYWTRPLLKTAVILSVWILVHLATRRLLKRLHHLEEYLRICAWCGKLDHHGDWMTMEEYLGSAFATKTSHGVCPDCSRTLEKSGPAARPVCRTETAAPPPGMTDPR